MNTYITFEEFTSYVEENLLKGWRDNRELRIEKVKKNNGITLTGVVIFEENVFMAPTLYLEEFYSDYCMGRSLSESLLCIRRRYEEYEKMMEIDMDDFFDFETMKDSIIFRLVNYEKNKQQLEDCPYIKIYDLALTFRTIIIFEDSRVSSALVNYELMEDWGISKEELILLAKENTRRIFPEKIMAMDDITEGDFDEGNTVYVATNVHMMNGASVILYDGILEDFSKKIGGNYYVVPSSVHEMLFIPENLIFDGRNLKAFVKDMNDSFLEPQDVLSNSLYYYDSKEESLSCVE